MKSCEISDCFISDTSIMKSLELSVKMKSELNYWLFHFINFIDHINLTPLAVLKNCSINKNFKS